MARAAGSVIARSLAVAMALLCASSAAPAGARAGTLELHTHLFMEEGMGWMMRGGFDGPLRATSYEDRFSSMANWETLQRSNIQLMVVSLYAHPLFSRLKPAVRRQMDRVEALVARHPEWVLARHPREARAAIRAGKRVIVYSLEGASRIIEGEEDLAEFVDRRGLRIVTLLHLTDDSLGGAAFLPGLRVLSSPLAWLGQLFSPTRVEGVRINPRGLTDEGRAMAEALIRRKVWIDLAHASDPATRELVPMLRSRGLPLLYTHTTLRKFYGAERGLADWQLEEVARSGGVIGLLPSEDMLEGTPHSHGSEPGGVPALARQFNEVTKVLEPEAVSLGSDYNGGIPHLRPIPPYREHWNIGQAPELWEDLRKAGARVALPPERAIERFLRAWERVTGS